MTLTFRSGPVAARWHTDRIPNRPSIAQILALPAPEARQGKVDGCVGLLKGG